METLGEMIAELGDDSRVDGLLAQLDNTMLLQKLDQRALSHDRRPSQIACEAVRAFASGADDEAWLKLLGRVQDARSPAAACLAEMLAWSMKA